MAFPTIPTAAANTLLSSTTSTASTTHTFPSLTTLAPAAGDLIIAICVQYDGTTSGQFSSWGASLTEILDSQSTGTGAGALGVAYKIATGSESGTFTVTSADSFKSVNFLMRIPQTTWHGVIEPEVQTPTRAAGAVADPGSFDPNNWGAEDTLWISLGAHTETTTAGSPPTLDSPPTNFSGQLIVARAADAVGDITAGVSFRQQNAAAQDVGTWTTSNATRGNGIATVIAVPPKIPFAKTGEIAVSPRAASGEKNGVYSRTGAGRIDVSEKKIIDSVYTGFGESGCSVAISGNGSIVVMGARSQSGGGNAYVYTGTNWSTETKLTASDIEAGDKFGEEVAISRDGSIVAVSANEENSLRGAVYMYSGTNWATETKLVASDREISDKFGDSVAISPDGSVLAVGASGENGMGAVYIYTGTNWSTETKLVASDRASGDNFGNSVALSEDGSTLAVGAFWEDGAGSNRGAVYMYSGTNWATETKLVASDAANDDWFGVSVALSGDGSILAVGAQRVGNDLGAIYMCTGTNWSTQQKLSASDLQPDDELGFDVALSKDGSILVGGMYRQSGHCSVYLYGPPSYTEYRRLVPFEGIVGGSNNQFGFSVAVSDDGSTVLVGAKNAEGKGASYVFTPKGLSGGGTKTTLTKQGGASAIFKGSAISASEFDRSGIAKSIFTASGVDAATRNKSRIAISSFTSLGLWTGRAEFEVAVVADDGRVYAIDTFYPPTTTTATTTGSQVQTTRGFFADYDLNVGLMRWDTSTLPDDSTITAAWIRIDVFSKTNADGRNLVAGWYDWGPTIGTEDYTSTPETDAIAGFSIDDIHLGEMLIPLVNANTNVNRGGYTYLRTHIDGGIPTGQNSVTWIQAGGTRRAARLILQYVDPITYQKKNDGGIGVGSEFTGGGVYEKIGDSGNTYQKKNDAGTGVGTDFVGSSTDDIIYVEAGAATSAFAASGADVATANRTGFAQTGDLPFPQFATSITDDFNRADQDPLSGNGWFPQTARLVSNRLTVSATPSDGGVAERSAPIGHHEMVIEIATVIEHGDFIYWRSSLNVEGYWTRDGANDMIVLRRDLVDGVPQHSVTLPAQNIEAIGYRHSAGREEWWLRVAGVWSKALGIQSSWDGDPAEIWVLELWDSDDDLALDNYRQAAVVESQLIGDGMKASGGDATTYVESGTAISEFGNQGSDAATYVESGTASSDFTGGGASEAPVGTRMAQVAWAYLLLPKSGVVVYAKYGTAISDFVASGADATTYVESGVGVSEFSAFGSKAKELLRTGSAISEFTASGADVVTYLESGSTVCEFIASGTDASTYVESGIAISDFIASGTSTETQENTGTTISDFVVSGADEVTYVESGSGISDFVASGSSTETQGNTGTAISEFTGGGVAEKIAGAVAKVGTGISEFVVSGADAISFIESGITVSDFIASGESASTWVEAGTTVSEFAVSGADAVTYVESGNAVSDFTASGLSAEIAVGANTAISDFVASGVDEVVYVETGNAVSSFTASGSDASTFVESGIAISIFTTDGDRDLIADGSNTAVSIFVGSGADAVTYVESGIAISERVAFALADPAFTRLSTAIVDFSGSGVRVSTFVESGSGVSAFVASGVSADTFVETGTAITAFIASGDKAETLSRSGLAKIDDSQTAGANEVIYVENGNGISDLTASGTRQKDSTRTGVTASEFTASGADEVTYVESGSVVSSFAASGADESTHTETGTGIIDFVASGASSRAGEKRGTAISEFTASGTDADTLNRTGVAVSSFTASGADASTYAEMGAGILDNLVGGSYDAAEFHDTGSGVLDLSGSGSRARELPRSGTAIAEFAASGTHSEERIESGSGVMDLVASGVSAAQYGTTYQKVGTGTIDFAASGDDATTSSESGAGVLSFTGEGSRSRDLPRTGSGVVDLVGAGDGSWEITDSGAAISPFSLSGALARELARTGSAVSEFLVQGSRITEFGETGTGVIEFIASGTRQKDSTRTGVGIVEFIASGFDIDTLSETGAGVASHTGTADSRWETIESGTGIIGASASGTAQKQGEPVVFGTAISDFVGAGDASWTLSRSGTGVDPRVGSGTDAATYVESGTGVAIFTGSGEDSVTKPTSGRAILVAVAAGDQEFILDQANTAVAPFVASGIRQITIERTGTGVIGFIASGYTVGEGAGQGIAESGFFASGTRSITHLRSGAGIVEFSASGARVSVYGESGTGIIEFTISGALAGEKIRTNIATTGFVVFGDGIWELDRLGVGAIDFVGSGESEPGFETKAGTAILNFVGRGRSGKKKRKAVGVGSTAQATMGAAETTIPVGVASTVPGPTARGETRPRKA